MSRTKVTIEEGRILHVNGSPFFPIGARHMPVGATPALLNEIGFNCMRWTPFSVDASAIPGQGLPDDLGGLMFYPYVFNRGDLSKDADARRGELEGLVLQVRDHPSLLCYEQRNEPAYTWDDCATPQGSPEGMAAGSSVIRGLDPNHPVRVGHMDCNLVSTLRKYNAATDIVGCNPYVVFHPEMRRCIGFRPDRKLVDCPNQTLSSVGDLTTKMMRVAEGRPVWMQIQAMSNEDWFSPAHTPENKRTGKYEHLRLFPSRWQMRFMAFNAIIRGATGLEWALHCVEVDKHNWQDIRAVIGELKSLQDVFSAPVWAGSMDVEYKELGFSDWTGVETLVKMHNGECWILAANTQFDPMEPTFSRLPEGIGGKLAVVGENREIPVQAGTFTDRFQPYEVHVYQGKLEATDHKA